LQYCNMPAGMGEVYINNSLIRKTLHISVLFPWELLCTFCERNSILSLFCTSLYLTVGSGWNFYLIFKDLNPQLWFCNCIVLPHMS
jgi:hypothetical protein